FTTQPWAGIICNCSHPDKSEHACCPTAQHNTAAARTDQEGAEALSSSHCTSEVMSAPEAEFENLPQDAKMCCHALQKADTQMVAVSSTKQLPVETTLPPIQMDAQTTIAPESVCIHPQLYKRPLYMAFSCWLI